MFGFVNGPITFIKRLVGRILKHDTDEVAAMLAYYAVLAIFPMLIFVVATTIWVFPTETLLDGLNLATRTFPGSIRDLLTEQVKRLAETPATGLFAIVGALVALWGASRAAVALMRALNRVYGLTESRSWIRRQLTAIAVTLGVAALVIVALALLAIGPIAGHWLADRFALGGVFDTVWTLGRWVGAALALMLVWAIAYRFLPDGDGKFRMLSPGVVVGVGLWLGISWLFGLYVSTLGSYAATYGAVGTAVILLTWIWLSNMALLLGAEIDGIWTELHGGTGHGSRKQSEVHGQAEAPGRAHRNQREEGWALREARGGDRLGNGEPPGSRRQEAWR